MAAISLLVSDFIISFMWVWSGTLIKIFVHKILGLGHEPSGEVIQCVLSIINIFFFAFLGKITEGGAYNPLNVLASAISGNFSSFLFGVGARIPSQVIGSITGVKLIIETFPEIGLGPRLNIDIHRGALTEGFLAFAIVIISLGLATKIPGSFFMKTWISSVSKAMGWAYARGDHITKEHVLVYWLAPIEATLLAVWIFRLLVRPMKEEKANTKSKSE
ncbi:probable aquaporin SIP2-1 isoform X2 [Juglans microcarpa x Juglans regia]|uniref:probable aquaporin SIP2-1 isoform X2 n=1 Tax=Juglans microcarpa x Juglans regia TaxID=2249226 RepID=UPI001B7F3F9B|nr:probable aquaporin SIP2-1 isoform X2 [Juglans microcarpa x Juglans regia]